MISFTRSMRLTALVLGLTVAGLACGESQPEAPTPETNETASRSGEEATMETVVEESVGAVRFTVDGIEKSFETLPKASNVYTSVSSTIRALPGDGTSESLAITFLSIDLKKQTYPTELPLPRDPSKPMSPMAAMATVGFGYIDGEGVEWAGPGKIQVDSFGNDGVVRGTFDRVSIPHTDKERADIVLTSGEFEVRITSPW